MEAARDILHCPECNTPFEACDGVRYTQQGFPAVLYCHADCLLDAREKRSGRNPRLRWPKMLSRFWRGKEIRG